MMQALEYMYTNASSAPGKVQGSHWGPLPSQSFPPSPQTHVRWRWLEGWDQSVTNPTYHTWKLLEMQISYREFCVFWNM